MLYACPSLLYCCWAKTLAKVKTKLERKGLISIYSCSSSWRKVGTRPPDGNLEARTAVEAIEERCLVTYTPPYVQSYLLISLRPTCPGLALPKGSWPLPHQSTIQKMLHRHNYRPVWQRHFLNWGSLLQVTLCLVDKKQPAQITM